MPRPHSAGRAWRNRHNRRVCIPSVKSFEIGPDWRLAILTYPTQICHGSILSMSSRSWETVRSTVPGSTVLMKLCLQHQGHQNQNQQEFRGFQIPFSVLSFRFHNVHCSSGNIHSPCICYYMYESALWSVPNLKCKLQCDISEWIFWNACIQ